MTIRLARPLPDCPRVDKPAGGNDRLDSWKEIASYLRREVRTVQLWEKNEGMPVHRHFHKHLGSVYAFRSEIDRWREQVSHRTGKSPAEAAREIQSSNISHVMVYVAPLRMTATPADHRELGQEITTVTIAALQQLDPTRVTVLATGSAAKSPRPAGKETGRIREYILQWSLQNQGTELQVDVSLVLCDDGTTAWSCSHRSPASESVQMPTDVSRHILQGLWLRLLCLPAKPAAIREQKRGAREAYLRGRYFWNQRSEEGLRRAKRCFESAIQEDPNFALPYSGLADSLTLLSFYEIVSSAEAMPLARRAALKAIELGPDLAESHASLADVMLHFDRNWTAADQEYRRAIQCNPGYALGYHWYSNLLAARGQHEAAHLAIMHALDLDPVSIITLVWAGVTSHLAHRFEEAIKHYQSALELDPHFVWAHMYMAQALEQTGNFKQAVREFDKTIHLAGGNSCVRAMQAHAYAAAGDTASARQILRELRGGAKRAVPSYDIAAVYAALGDSHQVTTWLHRACQERNMKVFTLTQDPRFDSCRRGSDFQAIIAQVGLSNSSQSGLTRPS
jgi:tetratricopeptide (TPR) repeat protein